MELVTCFKFDKDGYFVKEVLCQKDESGILLAKNSTPVAPDQSLLGKNFLKWDGKQWLPEPKPTTAQECAALGDLDHHSQTERVHELRKLFDDLTSGSEKWRVEQDPETLAKRVVAILRKKALLLRQTRNSLSSTRKWRHLRTAWQRPCSWATTQPSTSFAPSTRRSWRTKKERQHDREENFLPRLRFRV